MNRKQLALMMVLASVVMGLIGGQFFYEGKVGLNVPIYMTLATGILLLMARLSRTTINLRNLWVIIPMLYFAVMVAVRAAPMMIGLNMLAMLTLGTLLVRYLRSAENIDTASLSNHIFTPLDVGLYTIYAPLVETGQSLSFIRERNWKDVGNLGAVIRGLVFAVPVLLVFGVLLGSADEVFANSFDGIFDWLFSANIFDLFDPLFVAGVMGWLMLSALSYALARQIIQVEDTVAETDSENNLKKQRPSFRIGMIEATMVLGSVALLFGFFVMIQFTYLFGGQANIAETLNYSQYARRGFFELVAVAVLVLGMILLFDRITLRRDNRQGILFSVLSIVIVGLTMVMLVSAWRRMELYELAYGFTYLRVLTHVFMFWLAVLLVFAILDVMRLRTNIFALGVLLSCIGYIATLNVMNIDNYIAERNIQAYFADETEVDLDICYLRTLSVDAAPAMGDLFRRVTGNDDELAEHIVWWGKQNRMQNYLATNHQTTVSAGLFIYPHLDRSTVKNDDIQYACYGRTWY